MFSLLGSRMYIIFVFQFNSGKNTMIFSKNIILFVLSSPAHGLESILSMGVAA